MEMLEHGAGWSACAPRGSEAPHRAYRGDANHGVTDSCAPVDALMADIAAAEHDAASTSA